jgi:hypothetical protein
VEAKLKKFNDESGHWEWAEAMGICAQRFADCRKVIANAMSEDYCLIRMECEPSQFEGHNSLGRLFLHTAAVLVPLTSVYRIFNIMTGLLPPNSLEMQWTSLDQARKERFREWKTGSISALDSEIAELNRRLGHAEYRKRVLEKQNTA